jgi:hypothetical protein
MVIRPRNADSVYPHGIEGASVVDKVAEQVVIVLFALFLAMGFQAMADTQFPRKLIDYPVSTENVAYDPENKIRPPPNTCEKKDRFEYRRVAEQLEVDYVDLRRCDVMTI